MNHDTGSFKLIKAAKLIDGTGSKPVEQAAVLIKDDVIQSVGAARDVVAPDGAPVEMFDFESQTLVPGLVDSHVHLIGFGDGRSGDDLATLPDEVLTLQAARNAKLHLQSGVTAVRDCGAKNQTTLMLREAMNRGITPGPRLVLAGRPMAIIGGHLSYFGMQATGADECRAGVRQLIQAVANIPKPDAITSFVDRTKRGNHAATAPNQRRHTVTATTNRNRKTI